MMMTDEHSIGISVVNTAKINLYCFYFCFFCFIAVVYGLTDDLLELCIA